MNDELKAFCSDLRERLDWLTSEILRLAAENERLLQQQQSQQEEHQRLKAEHERVRHEHQALRQEKARWADERERLLRENQTLREEATVARLYRDLDVPASREVVDVPPAIPQQALRLFEQLPDSFLFGEFFQVADRQGLSSEVAKEHMLTLLRHRLLLQRGTRMQKNTHRPLPAAAPSSFDVQYLR
ncbi:hypothetical protein AWN76_001890 [Rhodothermaceae bacterium RA]|nr:hypothetical protein AWN76_001890 [Rhodothermaceae bacterium RA]